MRELFPLVILISVLTFWPSTAGAELLVTHSGETIETKGPWKVKGRQVVFTSTKGVLSSMRLSEVDLEASEETWKRRQEEATAPPREEPKAPKPVKRKSILSLTNDNIGGDTFEDAMSELGGAFGEMVEGMVQGMADGMEGAFGAEWEGEDEVAEGMGEAMQQGMEVLGEFVSVAVEIGLKANEIDQRYDLDTAQGMRDAAPEFDALASEVRGRRAGAKPEIQEMLDSLAQQMEDLAALAREDPEAAVRKHQQAKEEQANQGLSFPGEP